MSEDADKKRPPTFFANVVTSNLNIDELTMEFRQLLVPHKKHADRLSQPVNWLPPASVEEVMAIEPEVRIVLTFTAAKTLKEYLDVALPRIETARKTGKQP